MCFFLKSSKNSLYPSSYLEVRLRVDWNLPSLISVSTNYCNLCLSATVYFLFSLLVRVSTLRAALLLDIENTNLKANYLWFSIIY